MGILFNKDETQYQGQIRKYTGLFGSLFADLYITRRDKDGAVSEVIQIPIKYGPGGLRYKTRDTLDGVKYANLVPAMAFELVSINPDSVRKTAPYLRHTSPTHGPDGRASTTMTPVPHDFNYLLSIRSKNADDVLQVAERIIAAFNPSISLNIIDNQQVEIERDITIILNPDYSYQDNFEESQERQRYVQIDLNFTLKGYIYKNAYNKPLVYEVELQRVQNGFTEVMFDVVADDGLNNLEQDLDVINNLTSVLSSISK